MWYLIKSLFRYSLKNKLSTCLLSVLLFLSITTLSTLMYLSSNMNKSYDNLVQNGNLNNIVINNNYRDKIDDKPELSNEEAIKQNEKAFLAELDNLGLEHRNFVSLDFTNTLDRRAYKVIQSSPKYTIDKIVLDSGNNNYENTYNFSKILAEANWNDDSDIAKEARRTIIFLGNEALWTKKSIAAEFEKAEIALNKNSEISSPLYDPKNWSSQTGEIKEVYTYLRNWLDPLSSKYEPLTDKIFKMNFPITTSFGPVSGKVENFSGYFGVVPSYSLKHQNKEVIPQDWYDFFKKILTPGSYLDKDIFSQEKMIRLLKKIPDKYKIYIDSIPYIIVGTGISPDFMYPILSFDKITPNIKEEVLLYTSSSGYNIALDANRNNPISNYIVAIAKDDQINAVIDKINIIGSKYITIPGNIKIAYRADDTSNPFDPTGARIIFLPTLVNLQTIIANLISLFVLVLICIIFVLFIRKAIIDNQVSISILRSNGYKKRSIIWAMPIFAILPAVVGGLMGYICSFFLQSVSLNIYSFYWVIPTIITPFNIFILLVSILGPFLLMGIIAVITSYFIVRQNPNKLMSESQKFKISFLSKLIVKPFPKMNILSKFRLSVAFSSMARMIVITIMLVFSSSVLMFAVANNNKFEEAKVMTYKDKKYKYGFNLETPTIQGGQYLRTTFNNAGKLIFNENKELLNYNVAMTDANYKSDRGGQNNANYSTPYNELYAKLSGGNLAQQFSVLNSPSANDLGWQSDNIGYLRNKIQIKSLLDVNLGIGSLVSNPYDLIKSLGPTNMQNLAIRADDKFWFEALNDYNLYFTNDNKIKFPVWSKTSDWRNKIVNKNLSEIVINLGFLKEVTPENIIPGESYCTNLTTGKKYEINKSSFVNLFGTKINSNFLNIITYLYAGTPYSGQLGYNYANNFYKMMYNYVPMEIEDETYTYLKGNIFNKNNIHSDTLKIVGIKPESKYLFLNDVNDNNLINHIKIEGEDQLLVENKIHEIYKKIDVQKEIPIIINRSASYQYQLNIGDTFEFDPQNESTRYNPQDIYGKDINNKKFLMKVVAISSSSQIPELYINQRMANKILNLDHELILKNSYYDPQLTDDDIGYQIDPYNGFFTNQDDPSISSNSSVIYTIAGLSPTMDKFVVSKYWQKLINSTISGKNTNQLSYKINKSLLSNSLGYANDAAGYKAFDDDVIKWNAIGIAEDIITDLLIKIYGDNPYFSIVHTVDATSLYIELFNNTSTLVNNLLIIIVVIIYVISLLSIITLTFDLISSADGLIAMLKALGYSDLQNIITFTSIFIPSLLLSVILSIPLTMVIISGFTSFIYSFSNILLLTAFNWWYILIPLALFSILIGMLMLFYWHKMKKQNIANSIAKY